MFRYVMVFLAAALPASAQEFTRMPGVEYYCTGATGERYELGEVICITASCKTWTARCDMSWNSPMWRKTQDGCPGVSVQQRLDKLKS